GTFSAIGTGAVAGTSGTSVPAFGTSGTCRSTGATSGTSGTCRSTGATSGTSGTCRSTGATSGTSGMSVPASARATWRVAWYACQSLRMACARPVPSPSTITGVAATTITISTGALTVPWDAITWYAACPAMPRTREPRADHLANRRVDVLRCAAASHAYMEYAAYVSRPIGSVIAVSTVRSAIPGSRLI